MNGSRGVMASAVRAIDGRDGKIAVEVGWMRMVSFGERRKSAWYVGGMQTAAAAVAASEVAGAKELHARFLRRRVERCAWDAEEARDLRAAHRLRVWDHAGCVNLVEYLERFCGLEPRAAQDRIRVSDALGMLPALEAELATGALMYSHLRELVRIVVPATEQAWIDRTRGMTVGQVQKEVSGRAPGDWPEDDKNPDEEWVRVTFTVRPATKARLHATMRGLAEQRGTAFIDEDDAILAVCDAMESDATAAAAPAQVWLTPDLRTFEHGHELTDEEAAVHACTGTLMGGIHEEGARKRKAMSDKKKQRILARDGFMCCVPGCRNKAFLDVHHIQHVAHGGANDDDNLATMCGGHHRLLHRGRIVLRGRAPTLEVLVVANDEQQTTTRYRRRSRPAWAGG